MGRTSARVRLARRAWRSLDSSPTRGPGRPGTHPAAAADSLGGEDVRTGFMASSRSLARFASRCSGASPDAKPNRPPGILPLRASGIRGRPSPPRAGPQGERAGSGGPARRPVCRAAAASWQGWGQLSHAGSRGLRRATPAPWRGLRHPPHGHATDQPCTGVMWSKFRQKCYAARVFRPNST